MRKIFLLSCLLPVLAPAQSIDQSLDQIGAKAFRAVTTNLDGTGIRVAQPEANTGGSFPAFEASPAVVQQPTNLFTYYSDLGTATGFTNLIGAESGHADGVAGFFYGRPGGVATNVAHVDNYDADFFITNYIFNLAPAPPAMVVNQSFTFGALSVTDQQSVDSAYDDYEETFGTLFVSSACDSSIYPLVCAPGTAYNCICVASYGGNSSIGPTIDNGRCKPDITAPQTGTSFSTPEVSGAAAVLMQAALRGDGGADTNSAVDNRTLKALLLNGAVKPPDWTNGPATPLDARYGAGMMNLLNSYEQLTAGEYVFCATNLIPPGAAHPPSATTNTIASPRGWDLEYITSTATNDAVNEYFFNASNGIFTATLVWNRQLGETNINDLNLFLFDANSNLVLCSTSAVDNVQHIYVPQLAAGRYDLQVLKKGGTNVVSNDEVYALAYEFISPQLSITNRGTNASLSWPLYPAGFLVEAETNLLSASWSTNNLPAAFITNSVYCLPLEATNPAQFFHLRRPNF
ncbi:MAG TPA: S8 family serine peptidase [Candidatus Sulfotelmatobacter sp.]|nr:S8 family serine peptidase [Candidatus Sulfotelmatobacter sp.]